MRHGFEVHAISSPGPRLDAFAAETGIPVYGVPMVRRIDPAADLRALVRLLKLFRRIRPEIVHSHTPKAGMLAMMAAAVLRVPVRLYTMNGLVFVTRAGWQQQLLKLTERLSCRLATEVVAVSPSLRDVALSLELCAPGKLKVIGHGGSHGVDLRLFHPDSLAPEVRAGLRARLGIPKDSIIVAFVGRLNRDKGIRELSRAWTELRREFPKMHLLVCGRPEPGSATREWNEAVAGDERVHCTGFPPGEMPGVYAIADIGVLPTYREGLPNVALEFGAMRVPLVATNVCGCVDIVADGSTGLLIPPRDAAALASAVRGLAADPALRARMGDAARRRVSEYFSEDLISSLLIAEYDQLLLERAGISRHALSAVSTTPNEAMD